MFCLYPDEILRRYSVELEVPGEPVHAASELDLGVDSVRERLGLHLVFRPLKHRLKPTNGRSLTGAV